MRRTVKFFVVWGMSLVVFSANCSKNEPPATPQLSGPTTGNVGDTLTFTFSAADPENQEIEYMIAWDDTSAVDWSVRYPSGQEVTRTHVFADSGVYHVEVKARDIQLAESEWSNSAVVSIVSLPPHQPGRPSGPASCTTGVAYTYTAKTTHPLGDSVWFQFDWGEEVGNWGGPVASDSQFREPHSFDSAGTFSIVVRAKDARGGTSAWSEPLAVSVARAEALATPSVSCEAINTGATLRLSWYPVQNAESYEIQVDDSVYTTVATSFDVSVPAASIGVRSVRGSTKSDPATIDCCVVETPNLEIYGFTDPDTSHHGAFGFDSDGSTVTYSLYDFASFAALDYFADDGSYSPIALVNPGSKHFNPKGNKIAEASATSYDEITIADPPGVYSDSALTLAEGGFYYLWLDRTDDGWSEDDHFAKAQVLSINGHRLTMRVGYQEIGGLRWLTR